MLSLPIFILSHENWVYIVGISKKNHQISLVFAKNLWSWTLDPIPYENTSQKFQLWTPGHISGSRMNFWPDSILGGSLACREPRKTHIFMAQGSPLAGQFTIQGYCLSGPRPGPLDPLRVQLVFKGLSLLINYNRCQEIYDTHTCLNFWKTSQNVCLCKTC